MTRQNTQHFLSSLRHWSKQESCVEMEVPQENNGQGTAHQKQHVIQYTKSPGGTDANESECHNERLSLSVGQTHASPKRNFFGLHHTVGSRPYVLPPVFSDPLGKQPLQGKTALDDATTGRSSMYGEETSVSSLRRERQLRAPSGTCDVQHGGILPPQTHATAPEAQRMQKLPVWKLLLTHPVVKLALGLVLGLGLLGFVATLVNLPQMLQVIQQHLTTTRGILYALLASVVFLLAFFFRSMRWKLFLNPVGQVSVVRVVQLFLVGVFLNFLVPIRIGEVAKSLVLKRVAHLPVGQTFSTITMDKVFDLFPAVFTIALVPVLGIQLDVRFWSVLGLANAVLLGMVLFVLLSAWKPTLAITILHFFTRFLPSALGRKIEDFATGFVDAVLMSAQRPTVFLLALALTAIGVCFDGLYNMFAFWTIGYPIPFGQAVFGYMVFNLFYILPSPPGQVGSNEVVGILIFHGLLHIPTESVLAMVGLFHLWSALLMCTAGMTSLSALGVTLSSTMKMRDSETTALHTETRNIPSHRKAIERPL